MRLTASGASASDFARPIVPALARANALIKIFILAPFALKFTLIQLTATWKGHHRTTRRVAYESPTLRLASHIALGEMVFVSRCEPKNSEASN